MKSQLCFGKSILVKLRRRAITEFLGMLAAASALPHHSHCTVALQLQCFPREKSVAVMIFGCKWFHHAVALFVTEFCRRQYDLMPFGGKKGVNADKP